MSLADDLQAIADVLDAQTSGARALQVFLSNLLVPPQAVSVEIPWDPAANGVPGGIGSKDLPAALATLAQNVRNAKASAVAMQSGLDIAASERAALITELAAVKAALALPARATQADIVNAINAKTAITKTAAAAPTTVTVPVAGAIAVGSAGVGFLGGYVVRGMVDKSKRRAPAARETEEKKK
jgi:hypothetical protein